MKIRLKFNKTGNLRYISHLDLIRVFKRAFIMGNVDLLYSAGFNPQPKVSIGNPLPLGINSEEEYIDMDLVEEVDGNEIMDALNAVLPSGIRILDYSYDDTETSVSRIIEYALYEFKIYDYDGNIKDIEEFVAKIDEWLSGDEILITRTRKKKGRKTEVEESIAALIKSVKLIELGEDLVIHGTIQNGAEIYLKPELFFSALNRDLDLNIDESRVYINRLRLYDSEFKDIMK